MGDSLRQALIDRDLISTAFTAADGYLSVGIHSREEGADIALAIFADWLDRRARLTREARGPVPYESPEWASADTKTWLAVANVLERMRDEIRAELTGG